MKKKCLRHWFHHCFEFFTASGDWVWSIASLWVRRPPDLIFPYELNHVVEFAEKGRSRFPSFENGPVSTVHHSTFATSPHSGGSHMNELLSFPELMWVPLKETLGSGADARRFVSSELPHVCTLALSISKKGRFQVKMLLFWSIYRGNIRGNILQFWVFERLFVLLSFNIIWLIQKKKKKIPFDNSFRSGTGRKGRGRKCK